MNRMWWVVAMAALSLVQGLSHVRLRAEDDLRPGLSLPYQQKLQNGRTSGQKYLKKAQQDLCAFSVGGYTIITDNVPAPFASLACEILGLQLANIDDADVILVNGLVASCRVINVQINSYNGFGPLNGTQCEFFNLGGTVDIVQGLLGCGELFGPILCQDIANATVVSTTTTTSFSFTTTIVTETTTTTVDLSASVIPEVVSITVTIGSTSFATSTTVQAITTSITVVDPTTITTVISTGTFVSTTSFVSSTTQVITTTSYRTKTFTVEHTYGPPPPHYPPPYYYPEKSNADSHEKSHHVEQQHGFGADNGANKAEVAKLLEKSVERHHPNYDENYRHGHRGHYRQPCATCFSTHYVTITSTSTAHPAYSASSSHHHHHAEHNIYENPRHNFHPKPYQHEPHYQKPHQPETYYSESHCPNHRVDVCPCAPEPALGMVVVSSALTFEEAQCACARMDMELAAIDSSNTQEVSRLLGGCALPQTAWVQSWNGDRYNGACLTFHVGGAITPGSCGARQPALCQARKVPGGYHPLDLSPHYKCADRPAPLQLVQEQLVPSCSVTLSGLVAFTSAIPFVNINVACASLGGFFPADLNSANLNVAFEIMSSCNLGVAAYFRSYNDQGSNACMFLQAMAGGVSIIHNANVLLSGVAECLFALPVLCQVGAAIVTSDTGSIIPDAVTVSTTSTLTIQVTTASTLTSVSTIITSSTTTVSLIIPAVVTTTQIVTLGTTSTLTSTSTDFSILSSTSLTSITATSTITQAVFTTTVSSTTKTVTRKTCTTVTSEKHHHHHHYGYYKDGVQKNGNSKNIDPEHASVGNPGQKKTNLIQADGHGQKI